MARNSVERYYHTAESVLGYRLLGGVKHFGYYPKGQENLPTRTAQERMDDELAKALALKPGSKVLDAGCGEGGVALYLASHLGLNVVGVDLLDFNIARARKAARHEDRAGSVIFDVADYAKTKLGGETFDGVYTMETLVHAPDFNATLDEFSRLLKPGGKLAMFEYSLAPVMPQEAKKAFTKVNKLAAMPAFNQFTHGTLEQALRAHGFEDVSSKDITERMLPLLKRFERRARVPYKIATALGLGSHVVNAMSSVVMTKYLDYWRYNVITARLPNERKSST